MTKTNENFCDLSIHFQGDESEPWTFLELCRLCGALYSENLYGNLSEERLDYILEPASAFIVGFGTELDGFEKDDETSQDDEADRIGCFLYEGGRDVDTLQDYTDVVAEMKRRACQR